MADGQEEYKEVDPNVEPNVEGEVDPNVESEDSEFDDRESNNRPVTFSLGPGLVDNNQVIDYSKRAGAKLYEQATAKLSEDLYDCEPNGMRSFQELFKERCSAFGWETSVFDVPQDPSDVLGNTTSLLKYHGKISLTHLQEFAKTYGTSRSRAAQDSVMAYRCLMASLSKDAINKVTIWKKDYFVDGVPNGPCLYKVILRESHIDTNATVSHIRTQLSSLDLYLPTINNDISRFNRYVKQLVEGLESRGDSTDSSDLLSNLFKGYKVASDQVFVSYIERKEADYHEDVPTTPDQLMYRADNKYKQLIQSGKWNAPSPNEEKIMALEAKLEKFGKIKKPNEKGKTKPYKGKGTKHPSKYNKEDDPAWMSEAPNDGGPITKQVDGKEWKWCGYHKKWGRHHEDACKAKAKKPTQDQGDHQDDSKKVKLANALAAMMSGQDNDSDTASSDEDQE